MKQWVVVVGGTNMDVVARTSAPLVPATSNPGHTRISPGGVGRNIAACLGLLGAPVRLVSAVGDDAFGDEALRVTAACGADVSAVRRVPGAHRHLHRGARRPRRAGRGGLRHGRRRRARARDRAPRRRRAGRGRRQPRPRAGARVVAAAAAAGVRGGLRAGLGRQGRAARRPACTTCSSSRPTPTSSPPSPAGRPTTGARPSATCTTAASSTSGSATAPTARGCAAAATSPSTCPPCPPPSSTSPAPATRCSPRGSPPGSRGADPVEAARAGHRAAAATIESPHTVRPDLADVLTDGEPLMLTITDEVRDALASGQPVVALESTIISHGMPYPQNVEMARTVEGIVREGGAVPATIAVLHGRPTIGLSPDDLELLASDESVIKVSHPRPALRRLARPARRDDRRLDDAARGPRRHRRLRHRRARRRAPRRRDVVRRLGGPHRALDDVGRRGLRRREEHPRHRPDAREARDARRAGAGLRHRRVPVVLLALVGLRRADAGRLPRRGRRADAGEVGPRARRRRRRRQPDPGRGRRSPPTRSARSSTGRSPTWTPSASAARTRRRTSSGASSRSPTASRSTANIALVEHNARLGAAIAAGVRRHADLR